MLHKPNPVLNEEEQELLENAGRASPDPARGDGSGLGRYLTGTLYAVP